MKRVYRFYLKKVVFILLILAVMVAAICAVEVGITDNFEAYKTMITDGYTPQSGWSKVIAVTAIVSVFWLLMWRRQRSVNTYVTAKRTRRTDYIPKHTVTVK